MRRSKQQCRSRGRLGMRTPETFENERKSNMTRATNIYQTPCKLLEIIMVIDPSRAL